MRKGPSQAKGQEYEDRALQECSNENRRWIPGFHELLEEANREERPEKVEGKFFELVKRYTTGTCNPGRFLNYKNAGKPLRQVWKIHSERKGSSCMECSLD